MGAIWSLTFKFRSPNWDDPPNVGLIEVAVLVSPDNNCLAQWEEKYTQPTVDGSEIRLPPVEGMVAYPIIYKVWDTSQVVVCDFFYQQYEEKHGSTWQFCDRALLRWLSLSDPFKG